MNFYVYYFQCNINSITIILLEINLVYFETYLHVIMDGVHFKSSSDEVFEELHPSLLPYPLPSLSIEQCICPPPVHARLRQTTTKHHDYVNIQTYETAVSDSCGEWLMSTFRFMRPRWVTHAVSDSCGEWLTIMSTFRLMRPRWVTHTVRYLVNFYHLTV